MFSRYIVFPLIYVALQHTSLCKSIRVLRTSRSENRYGECSRPGAIVIAYRNVSRPRGRNEVDRFFILNRKLSNLTSLSKRKTEKKTISKLVRNELIAISFGRIQTA
jgi:hypothetical protein